MTRLTKYVKEPRLLFNKIRWRYWRIIPYDWRPSQIWYRLKCAVWHRYTTIKPATLPWNTWTDRDVLLAHTCFQILVDFVEKELKEEIGQWSSFSRLPDSPKIRVNGFDKFVIDEIMDLYRWWTVIYAPNFTMECDMMDFDNQLDAMLHRLIDIRRYLWT